MRTLLNESIPPFQIEDQTLSLPAAAESEARTVLENPVLDTVDSFLEVGVDGTAMSTPSESCAPKANVPPERGMAPSKTPEPLSSPAKPI